jgi:hypothetical protein
MGRVAALDRVPGAAGTDNVGLARARLLQHDDKRRSPPQEEAAMDRSIFAVACCVPFFAACTVPAESEAPENEAVGVAEAEITTYYDAMVNVESELCLDVPGFSNANGAWIQQYPCNYGDNQMWAFRAVPGQPGWITIRNLSSGKCLEIPGWYANNGVRLQQYACNGGTNQQWRVSTGPSGRRYQNRFSRKCIDIAWETHHPGFHVIQWTCHNDDNQRFVAGELGVAASH